MTVPLYNLTDTWNDGGTVFSAIKMNVTNTASAAGSKLLDLQIGGVSVVSVWGGTPAVANPTLQFGTGGNDGFVYGDGILSSHAIIWCGNGVGLWAADYGSNMRLYTTMALSWGAGEVQSAQDTFIYRDAANIVAQRNSTTAQTFRVYNTYTNGSNYERLALDWATTSNVMTIDVQVAGTGTQRVISLNHLDAATGGGTATFAATNCPATTLTTPYTWIKATSSDGSIVYMPAWK